MSRIELRYVQTFKDRHGKLRHYFRKPGIERRALPGLPGSTEFMAAYAAALNGAAVPARQIGAERSPAGSVSALCAAYYTSSEFKGLAPSTQATYRGVIERFRDKAGALPVDRFSSKNVREWIDVLADRPAAANARLAMLRVLMRFAKERGWRRDDPTDGVRKLKRRGPGFHTWTEEEINRFEARWPSGTRARLALALLLYTAQRRSDVVRMGRQHVRGDTIQVRQQKTGSQLAIPLHPALQNELALVPATQLTFLQTKLCKPFSPAGFTNWMLECAREAGLDGCSPHGLRKAASRRLAEAGCSASVIQSITGHKRLSEVALYTAAADQEGRARRGIAAISGTSTVKPALKV